MFFPPGRLLLSLVAMTSGLLAADVGRGQITIQRAAPWAVRPGSVTELTLHGAKLEGTLKLWTRFPAEIEAVPPAAGGASAVFKAKLAADVPPGIAGLVVGNELGASKSAAKDTTVP